MSCSPALALDLVKARTTTKPRLWYPKRPALPSLAPSERPRDPPPVAARLPRATGERA
jgi:hypothetical protein